MHDLIIIGGGIAGSSLALNMAQAGASVLLLEREAQYRDRIRGEGLHVWSSPDAEALGIRAMLLERCAHEVPFIMRYEDEEVIGQRDLRDVRPPGCSEIAFFHPLMQETLIEAAGAAGACVWRNAPAVGVQPGDPPEVTVRHDGTTRQLRARLVIGADGRRSKTRGWAGFETRRDPDNLRIAGVAVSGLPASLDALHRFSRPCAAWNTQFFALGNGQYRCYFVTGDRERHPLIGGQAGIRQLYDYMRDSRVPTSWIEALRIEGPLASFEAASWWVETPYRDGVALLGDAAAAPDPSFGNGLALAVHSARVLRDCLLEDADWGRAGGRYARAFDDTFGTLHRLELWIAEGFFSVDEERRAVREHAAAAAQRGDAPDLMGRGPYQPADEEARRRFLGY